MVGHIRMQTYFTTNYRTLHSTTNGTYEVTSCDTTCTVTATPIATAGFNFTSVTTRVGPNSTRSYIN